MKITLQDIKDIRIRRRPYFIDVFRVFIGFCIEGVAVAVFMDKIPDTRFAAGPCLVVFGILFMIWGLYPVCSKREREGNRFLEAYDRVMRYPETPGQIKRVHIPGTQIRVGYDADYKKATHDFDVDEYLSHIDKTATLKDAKRKKAEEAVMLAAEEALETSDNN